jgi:hypothetical protein
MLVTYKGTQTALHVDVDGKAFRLAPSQPVEINKAQADVLKERVLIKLLVESGEIEFSEPAKAVSKAPSKTKK